MGTSSSSAGPGSGVPFDPPWLNSIPPEVCSPMDNITGDSSEEEQNKQPSESITQPPELAPARRFANSRRYIDEYLKRGNRESLKKALGHYSNSGMGGSANVAKRMRTSTSVGAGLYDFLTGIRDSSDLKIRDWVNQLTSQSLSAYEIADQIIHQVISSGGSLEEESCRTSMAIAMYDLLEIRSEIDLMNLDNDTIWTILELFIANEAFNRIYLDIGQSFESAKYSFSEDVSRMNDMKEYLKSEISTQVHHLRNDNTNPTKDEINNLLQSALREPFKVFEEEI